MLKLRDIDVYYSHSMALNNVNIEISEGEFVSIIGANGAGKTTIMKTITGLLCPTKGDIIFNEKNITSLPPWSRNELGISYVPEGRRIFPDLSVEENLLIGGYSVNKAIAKESIDYSYEIFPQLYQRKNSLGKTLSGGEQQMLAISRALTSKPKLLLIDEMTIGLMPIAINKAFEIVKKLNIEGLTVLMVEQNAHKALAYSEKVYILKEGEIIYQSMTSEISDYQTIIDAYLGKDAM